MAKKKVVKANKAFVCVVLDETGSMQSVHEATVSAYNEYVENLKKSMGDSMLTLVKFNNMSYTMSPAQKISEWKKMELADYKPDNLTDLYDAIGKTIKKIGMDQTKADKFLMIIITDGEENASKEYKREQIFDMIKEKEKLGNWTFAYLGANQDSWKVGQSIGLARGNTMNFKVNKMEKVLGHDISRATCCFAAGGQSATNNFFKDVTGIIKKKGSK
jgi:Mg-chelatase subunit ChlD